MNSRMDSSFLTPRQITLRALARIQQPVIVDGETFVCGRDAEAISGYRANWLATLVRPAEGLNVVLTAPCGIRFVRVPRHRGDLKPILYYDAASVLVYGGGK